MKIKSIIKNIWEWAEIKSMLINCFALIGLIAKQACIFINDIEIYHTYVNIS